MTSLTSVLISLLIEAFDRRQRIKVHGDKLRVIPGKDLPPDFVDALRTYKSELITFLKLPDKERRALVEREPLPPKEEVAWSESDIASFHQRKLQRLRAASSLVRRPAVAERVSDLRPVEAERLLQWCGPDGDPSLVLEAVRLFNAKIVGIEPSKKFVPYVEKGRNGGEVRDNNPKWRTAQQLPC